MEIVKQCSHAVVNVLLMGRSWPLVGHVPEQELENNITGRHELQAAVSSREPQSALLRYQEQQLKPTTYLNTQ
jgi:hypothetical protein